MPVITSLERQKRNKDRVNVYLDDEFAFGIDEMDAAQLKIGQELSADDIVTLRYRDAVNKAVDRAINLLSRRPRSTEEIRRRLKKASIEEDVIELAIERLEQLGYLDDVAFARFWIENRKTFKPRGARALHYELRNKGVAEPIIRELVDDMVDENDAAYRAASKRVNRFRGSKKQDFKQKIGSFLQRRGFNYGVASRAIQTLIDELEAEDPTFFAEGDDDTIA